MANKNVNILLRLQDNFTKPLQGTTKQIKAQKAQINAATKAINKYADKANKAFKRITAVSAGVTAALGAAAIKTGFSEALDLEGYRMQLETATKDTKKASEIMQYAINLANKTPFEGGELVEGAAKFEAMGLSAKKWLTYAGDMAAATNKSFDQSVEALIDAQAGELERLKEFGITKAMILEKGEKMFAGVQIANNNGQIVNQEKFNEAMLALMEDKFAGGMEKQAKTVRGMWSTVTGVTKNALANILGMQNDGTVKAGSFLDLIRDKVGSLAEAFQQAQADGTIDAIGEKVAKGAEIAGKALEGTGNAIKWVYDHSNILIPALTGVVGGFAAFNILSTIIPLVTTLIGVVKGAAAAGGLLNAVMMANPLLAVAAAIGVVVAGFVLLYKNSERFRKVVKLLWETMKSVFSKIYGVISPVLEALKTIASVVLEIIGNVAKLGGKFVDWFTSGDGKGQSYSIKDHATGPPYFKGGLTHINEGGRGEIVNLPNGTQIIPHDVSEKSVGGSSVVVNLTVHGNVIGNRAFMEQTGDYIVRKIIAAQGVV